MTIDLYSWFMRYKLLFEEEELMRGSIHQIADYLGCTRQYIYQFKKGKHSFTFNYKNKKYSIKDRLFLTF